MIVRKKNKLGSISVVVVDKSHGFKEVKNFDVVTTDEEDNVLCMKASEWILSYGGQQLIDFDHSLAQDHELEEAECGFL